MNKKKVTRGRPKNSSKAVVVALKTALKKTPEIVKTKENSINKRKATENESNKSQEVDEVFHNKKRKVTDKTADDLIIKEKNQKSALNQNLAEDSHDQLSSNSVDYDNDNDDNDNEVNNTFENNYDGDDKSEVPEIWFEDEIVASENDNYITDDIVEDRNDFESYYIHNNLEKPPDSEPTDSERVLTKKKYPRGISKNANISDLIKVTQNLSNSICSMKKQINNINRVVNNQTDIIKKFITSCNQMLLTRPLKIDNNESFIPPKLPFSTIDNLHEFDEELNNATYLDQMVRRIENRDRY